MGNFLSGIVDGFGSIANSVFEGILLLLPTSPFVNIKSYLDPVFLDILGYVNYYIPIGTLLSITAAWLACIAVYYLHQLVLRTIKAVE